METSKQCTKPIAQEESRESFEILKPKNKRGVRGKRKCVKKYEKCLRFLGINAGGLKSKLTSFKKVIEDLKPSVFFLQETKFKEEGQFKLGEDYIIYELIRRQERGGGGIALGCLRELNPCWVSEGNDEVEIISVDIFLKNMQIRCCAAYGPQESDSIERKEAFWEFLDKEVDEASKTGSGFILQFDGNLWAGEKIIPGDPRPQNKNGKLLEQFLARNPNLTIVNSLPECQGLVTRSRIKNGVLEESVLDFFIVCSSLLPYVKSMVIDDTKDHILTNYKAAKKTGRAVDTDHFTLYLDMDIEIVKEKPVRQEIYNFKDKNSQEIFKINTSETTEFSECFDGKNSIIEEVENWRKVLNYHCSKAFKKIRIKDKKYKPINKDVRRLIDERNNLIRFGCICESEFAVKTELKVHQGKHTDSLKFECKQCGKSFRMKEGLHMHMRKHSDTKIVCAECGKQFNSEKGFDVHMKVHDRKTDLQSYQKKKKNSGLAELFPCPICSKIFKRNEQVEKHMTIHTDKQSHQCDSCGKIFQLMKNFKKHLKIHKELQENKCDYCKNKIALINAAIAEKEASENRKIIMKQFEFFSENPENIKMQNMWKILKNICPKMKPILPSAKKNHKGKIISGKNELRKLLEKEYNNRLRSRPFRNDLIDTKLRRKKLFSLKLRLSEDKISEPWTMNDMDDALKDLKRNKSRDNDGYINEIFKSDIIGKDLKASLLIMFNKLKKEKKIPEFMNNTNITTVPKKGPKVELKNQRGIFRVSVVRSILMRMIYNSNYDIIDKNISDGQMGARKGKGCKSNIWIVNGIIHETLQNKKNKPVVLQIYDYAQMFDSIDLEEALNDIFDYGLNNDNLSLVYKANKEVNMAVKTPGGLTDRRKIRNSVLQGDTFGSLLASVQVDTIAKDVEEAGVGLKYKNELPINILGLVDDMIGVSEAGFKAQIMNTILNLKSAEKGLQFGTSKCKMMIVGKNKENIRNNKIHVDKWMEEYIENKETGEIDLKEKYTGEVAIEEVQEQKYLGFILSADGKNIANIQAMERKSIGVIRTILNKMEKLKLRQYYFECSKILMNVILRGSILYAGECYYNLTENNLRRIEKIEEKYMRKIFKTSKSCPISQLYLEFGQWPARFELKKMRLLFLKQILQQDEESQLYKFFKLQQNNPIKGDWVSTVIRDLSDLKIFDTFEEIRAMTRNNFRNLIKNRIQTEALEYLQTKRGSKGQEIQFTRLEMSDFLLPYNSTLNIEEKRKMFEIRNRMTMIPFNFGQKEEKCVCGELESMLHIYYCDILNQKKPELSYDLIFNGNLKSQIEIFRKFTKNLETREELKSKKEFPCDLCDPLYCNHSISIDLDNK